ncbi:hypothetical protein CNE_BB1p04600 (plasmid) [Cupriavidus necator N-1]|uniref:Uncharacterized protein n=1 Tax=Cupriavidus necator (strain ATCC 43291 / DSM 13513 / CCUG 52238 / LMG 8453 / N-1) TaxID=1042878 RepID=F8GX14_CUPNN|nr:hypothetical protein CNE_BB1p04600 [Cupriavidus necator N-1]
MLECGRPVGAWCEWSREKVALDQVAIVPDFQQWVYDRLQDGKTAELLDYRRLAASGVRAHPTEEHLMPLFVALGAAAGNGAAPAMQREFAEVDHGILAMDVYRFARQGSD